MRKHIKHYQSKHYHTGDKRIKNAVKFAKRILVASQNADELGILNPKGFTVQLGK